MKPPVFEYLAPGQVDEAVRLLHALVQEQNRDVKLLAGGQSLIPLLNMRLAHPDVIIDINGLEAALSYVRREGDTLRIGGLTRHFQLKEHPLIQRYCPLIAEAVELIGHSAIITRGTIGGSLVHADPAAELPMVLVALGGSVTVRSSDGERTISAPELFLTYLTTSIAPDEILTEVSVPVLPERSGQALDEFSMRHGDFALVAAAAQVTLATDGALAHARLAVGGASATPVDCSDVLTAHYGRPPDAARMRESLAQLPARLDPPGDIHASAEYRAELAQTLSLRALERAIERASAAS